MSRLPQDQFITALDAPLNISHTLEKTPIALAGLAFGIASLGWSWQNYLQNIFWLQASCAVLAFSLSLLVTLKFLQRPQVLLLSLKDPVACSVLPTIAMCWVIVSQTVLPWSQQLAIALWCFALSLHLIIFFIFSLQRLFSFRFEEMMPAWFIPPIGLAVAAMANPSVITQSISIGLVYFAIFCCFIMLPLMAYRLYRGPALIPFNKPTLALFAAPPNLCLAGYLKYSHSPSLLLVSILLPLAIAMTAFAYVSFARLFPRSFTPVSAAFTFPCVIGASAMFSSAAYSRAHGLMTLESLLQSMAGVRLVSATAITLLVSLRFILHYVPLPYRKP